MYSFKEEKEAIEIEES